MDGISDESASLHESLDAVLQFGVAMLRAGSTAVRTRETITALANKMGVHSISVGLTIEAITVSTLQSDRWVTAVRDVGPTAINASRIIELEAFAQTAQGRLSAGQIARRLADLEATGPHYSTITIASAIGAASSGFAFINGAGVAAIAAAGLAGGIGQWTRVELHHRVPNPFGVATLSAIAASTAYILIATLMAHAGAGAASHPAGFVSAVLFLVPGFPLIVGLFDLLQSQTIAALSRLAYGFTILLAVAFGLSIVIVVADIDLSRHAPLEMGYPLRLALRGLASVAGGCAFAMLFNSPRSIVLTAGLVAFCANELRLAFLDAGMALAAAAFLGALAVGLMSILSERRLSMSRIAVAVAPTVIMIPGVDAFKTIVFLQQGKMLDALQAAASCGFTIGALAMGLAIIRMTSTQKN